MGEPATGSRGRGGSAVLREQWCWREHVGCREHGEVAQSLNRQSIAHLSRTRVRLELARTHLLYGEWLRRIRRGVDARRHVRTALEEFTSMGTEAFAGWAERELWRRLDGFVTFKP